jgi:6-pyruvoyltetrahydropterin/6-carboxytetrahydropterin synthase
MVFICRKEHFSAAHRLYNPAWSPEKNCEVYGVCANPNWHGHNFELVVKVGGEIDTETGWVMDMKVLGRLIKESIIERVDHKNLNEEVDFLKNKFPSCEVMVMEFWKILAPQIEAHSQGRAHLHSLTLWETEKNFVEYFGNANLEREMPQR